ncbi:MAG TPA: hypothetical protein VKA63_11370 [Candidatus Krumholzibacteria bacterium]|nr:hypothetical protein [Candidatus Krumholzibacteria bacterium]
MKAAPDERGPVVGTGAFAIRMRTGFLVTLPEQLESFEAVLRRTPGSRILVAKGRWHSPELNSRAEVLRSAFEHGLEPLSEPQGEFDLLVSQGEVPEFSLRAWLRERGALVEWRDPGIPGRIPSATLTLVSGPSLCDEDPSRAKVVIGDPALDTALQPGARSRARYALGLSADSCRPLILLRAEATSEGIRAMTQALASLRVEADLVLSCSTARRLLDPRPFGAALAGPGIYPADGKIPEAELLAASDLVLAEAGTTLLRAAALGRPALGLGSCHPGGSLSERETPLARALRAFEWVEDSDQLARARAWLRCEPIEMMRAPKAASREILGPVDGNSVRRAVQALKLLGAQCGAREGLFS